MRKVRTRPLLSASDILLLGAGTILFVAATELAPLAADWLRPLSGIAGMAVYLTILIVESIVAPVSSAPLTPIAAELWGAPQAAAVTLVGWVIGATASFQLARWVAPHVAQRWFAPTDHKPALDRWLGHTAGFSEALSLRLLLPSDIVSYALALFTGIRFGPYVAATALAYLPHAIAWSYLGQLPQAWRLVLILAAVVAFLWYWGGQLHAARTGREH